MAKTENLKKKYDSEVKAAMKEKFGYKNDHQIPKLHKIVLNMGVGEASHNSKIAEAIEAQLTKIAGQKAVVTKAKKINCVIQIKRRNACRSYGNSSWRKNV